ncbi:MAG: J domain-containing protein [Cytophagaceae bacterium]
MQTGNYYDILGISPTASKEDIKKAYKKLAKIYHPDINRHNNAGMHFLMIRQAYETLFDPTSRHVYDQQIQRGGPALLTYEQWKAIEKRRQEEYEAKIHAEFLLKKKAFQASGYFTIAHIGLYAGVFLSYLIATLIVLCTLGLMWYQHWITFFWMLPLVCLAVYLFFGTHLWFKDLKRFFT